MKSRIDAKLCEYEGKQGIDRWTSDSEVFKDMKRIAEEVEKERIIDAIASCANEQWFLLNLKAKFAGSQCLHVGMVMLQV